MKLLKKMVCASAVALSMAAGAAQAGPILNNWIFNAGAGGAAGGITVAEYLDVVGSSFIQITPSTTVPKAFSFVEHGVFNIPTADAGPSVPGGFVSATLDTFGTGMFSGAFQFGGGTINVYSNPTKTYADPVASALPGSIYGANLGTQLATFTIQAGGGGLVDGTGNPLSSGQVTVDASANAGDITAGHFFNSASQDLSSQDVLAFAFTGANPVSNPNALLVQEVACQFAGFTGPGCGTAPNTGTYSNVPGDHLFVNNSGSFKLAAVPEPGSVALFGIAMLGVGAISRKRKSA